MIFQQESLYGWGVCCIPMPRSTQDILSDRRKRVNKGIYRERRRNAERQSALKIVSGLLAHDVHWPRTFLTISVSALSVILVFLSSFLIPVLPEPKRAEPVEIEISVKKEFDPVPPINRHVPKNDSQKPPMQVRTMEKKPATPSRAPLPQLQNNDAQVKLLQAKMRPMERRHVRSKPSPPPGEKAVMQEAVAIKETAIPTPMTRNPVHRERKSVAGIPQSKASAFFSEDTDTALADIPAAVHRYSPIKLAKNEAVKENADAPIPLPSGRTDSFLTDKDAPTQIMAPAGRTQKDYHRKIDPGNRISMVSTRSSEVFKQKEDPGMETFPAKGPLSRNRVRSPEKVVTPDDYSGAFLADHLQPEPSDISVEKPTVVGKTFPVDEANARSRDPDLPRHPNRNMDFSSPENEMTGEGDVRIGPRTVLSAGVAKDDGKLRMPAAADGALDVAAIEEMDPSKIINLKQLAVCRDPEAEFILKTRLATLLSGPRNCRSDDMVFFFKYTESGYTLQVNIYNPRGILLMDRCSVLQMAIDCVENKSVK